MITEATMRIERPTPCASDPRAFEALNPRGGRAKVTDLKVVAAQAQCAGCHIREACRDFGASLPRADRRGQIYGGWWYPPAGETVPFPPDKGRKLADAASVHNRNCGKRQGYADHKKRGEDPCEPCATAQRTYMTEWQARRRAAAKAQTEAAA